MSGSGTEENWEILRQCLPDSWEEMAYELGALRRKRKFESAEALLRVLLIHLAAGKSLRTAAAYAREAGLCDVNDAALLHRLKASRDWFQWMCTELVSSLGSHPPTIAQKFRVLLVDASLVSEPGSTGTDWRLHYCFELNTFRCESFLITSPRVTESFANYGPEEGDLVVGDRGYCQRKGICHVLEQHAQVLVRFHSTNLPLLNAKGRLWPVLDHLGGLREGEVGDWDVWFEHPKDGHLVKGRLCSLKKSEQAFELARQKLLREAKKKGYQVQPATLEHARYVTVFGTVSRHRLSGKDVLELYRGRWQIELVFKRLKGIVGLGHLPKLNESSCKAWLYGKMLVALLAERLHREAQFFSPLGIPDHPIPQTSQQDRFAAPGVNMNSGSCWLSRRLYRRSPWLNVGRTGQQSGYVSWSTAERGDYNYYQLPRYGADSYLSAYAPSGWALRSHPNPGVSPEMRLHPRLLSCHAFSVTWTPPAHS